MSLLVSREERRLFPCKELVRDFLESDQRIINLKNELSQISPDLRGDYKLFIEECLDNVSKTFDKLISSTEYICGTVSYHVESPVVGKFKGISPVFVAKVKLAFVEVFVSLAEQRPKYVHCGLG